ncbi:MAG TPA: RNA polymerase sigma factor [Actinomycetota bacterium]|jgi:RNA polymerase sigma-70 factor (ECF subfamily)|nr:RNA polymerase sigma factor [Actinomycetota bacterium]
MAIGIEFPRVLDAARTGAEWAWRSLYQELAPTVIGYVRARGAHSPEDVCGEVFVQVVRDIQSFQGDEQGFRSWVFVMAHRRLLDEARRRKRRPETPVDTVDLRDLAAASDTATEAMAGVEEARLRAVLDELTPAQRDVVLLRVIADLSVEEVAQVIGKGPGAVKSLQHRALETLRGKLTEPSEDGAALTKSP